MNRFWLAAVLALAVVPVLAARAPAQQGVEVFTIDPRASTLWVRTYSEGKLALLAHDHVIVAEGIAGLVNLHRERIAASTVQLSVPVSSLEVDPPDPRARLGLEATIAEWMRDAIRSSMLGADQLDEARYPRIVATTARIEGGPPELLLSLVLRIRDVEKPVQVPVRVSLARNELRASGEIDLRHTDFGIVPYRFLFGTIAVQDRVKVIFELVARAQG
ncbi:MAG: YceI family protein [Candidatus Lambdaproteobacteria bacterium]|nr:YceI family protein [Candidatus Lambdaproteobacteria bacterium]